MVLKVKNAFRCFLLGLVSIASANFHPATINSAIGKEVDTSVASDQPNITSQGDSRSSNLFNAPKRFNLFRLPEFQSPRLSSLPGFSLLKQTASNSYAMTKRTSSRLWNQTKELLRPYDPVESSKDATYPSESKSTQSSWLWWKREPEEQKIETVNDFLRQERPKL